MFLVTFSLLSGWCNSGGEADNDTTTVCAINLAWHTLHRFMVMTVVAEYRTKAITSFFDAVSSLIGPELIAHFAVAQKGLTKDTISAG